MKKSILTTSLLVLLAFLLIYGCCKREDEICMDPSNPKCANYDPCHGVEPPSAMFIMQERFLTSNGWDWTPNDTVFYGGTIRYSSPYTDEKYKHTWYLGIEVIHDASFQRDHSSIPLAQRPTTITVSHVLEYPLDSDCYPNASGKDSVSRTYYLIRYWNEFATMGTFRGAFTQETDSFDFSFYILNSDGTHANVSSSTANVIAVNFHNEADSGRFLYNTRNKVLALTEPFSLPKGLMEIDPSSGKFVMTYKYKSKDFEVKGRKLN